MPRLYSGFILAPFGTAVGIYILISLPFNQFFEITDESYYLLNSWYPEDLSSASGFGYFNRVVMDAMPSLGIVELRYFGLIFLVVCGAINGALLAHTFLKKQVVTSHAANILLCAICGAIANVGF